MSEGDKAQEGGSTAQSSSPEELAKARAIVAKYENENRRSHPREKGRNRSRNTGRNDNQGSNSGSNTRQTNNSNSRNQKSQRPHCGSNTRHRDSNRWSEKNPSRTNTVCAYYLQPQGCRHGDKCHFSHEENKSDQPTHLSDSGSTHDLIAAPSIQVEEVSADSKGDEATAKRQKLAGDDKESEDEIDKQVQKQLQDFKDAAARAYAVKEEELRTIAKSARQKKEDKKKEDLAEIERQRVINEQHLEDERRRKEQKKKLMQVNADRKDKEMAERRQKEGDARKAELQQQAAEDKRVDKTVRKSQEMLRKTLQDAHDMLTDADEHRLNMLNSSPEFSPSLPRLAPVSIPPLELDDAVKTANNDKLDLTAEPNDPEDEKRPKKGKGERKEIVVNDDLPKCATCKVLGKDLFAPNPCPDGGMTCGAMLCEEHHSANDCRAPSHTELAITTNKAYLALKEKGAAPSGNKMATRSSDKPPDTKAPATSSSSSTSTSSGATSSNPAPTKTPTKAQASKKGKAQTRKENDVITEGDVFFLNITRDIVNLPSIYNTGLKKFIEQNVAAGEQSFADFCAEVQSCLLKQLNSSKEAGKIMMEAAIIVAKEQANDKEMYDIGLETLEKKVADLQSKYNLMVAELEEKFYLKAREVESLRNERKEGDHDSGNDTTVEIEDITSEGEKGEPTEPENDAAKGSMVIDGEIVLPAPDTSKDVVMEKVLKKPITPEPTVVPDEKGPATKEPKETSNAKAPAPTAKAKIPATASKKMIAPAPVVQKKAIPENEVNKPDICEVNTTSTSVPSKKPVKQREGDPKIIANMKGDESSSGSDSSSSSSEGSSEEE
jgi:hypothetical protein